jgi:predicted DNA-binding protein with PD1-like motif
MSHNLQSAVLMMLLSGKDWIFDDKSGTLEEVFRLTEKLFDKPNKWLTDNERASICAMIEAIGKRTMSDAHYKVLEGKSKGGCSSGHAALKKRFTKQQVTIGLRDHIDNMYNKLGVALMQLINKRLEKGEEFPNIVESECAKEDVMLAVAGNHAMEHVPHGDFRDALTSINYHTWERLAKTDNTPSRA